MMSKKRGRPAKYVKGGDGKPVVGLSYNSRNNQYYLTHYKDDNDGNPLYFGSDKEEAIYRFRMWEAQRKRVKVDSEYLHDDGRIIVSEDELQEGETARVEWMEEGSFDVIVEGQSISEEYFWAKARELILSDISEARKKLNLPIRLDGSFKPEKSITLQEVFVVYANSPDAQGLDKKYKSDINIFWAGFVRAIGNLQVADISQKHIQVYRNKIFAKGFKPKTIANRFNYVKGLLKIAGREVSNEGESQEIVRVLTLCQTRLNPPENQTQQRPATVGREEFHLLVNGTRHLHHKLIMMLAINCGMKSSDICDIKVTDIDLKKRTLVKQRHKTKIIRSAILWDETVDLIKQWLKVRPGTSPYLINPTGERFIARSVNTFFVRLRKRLGLSDDLKFEHFRDSTKTIAVEEKPELWKATDVLLGHKGDIGNQYLLRSPKMTREICQIVHDYYFG